MALGSTAFLESSICAVSYNTSKVFPKNVKGWIKGGYLTSEQRKEERECVGECLGERLGE